MTPALILSQPHLIEHFENDGVFYTARTPLRFIAIPSCPSVDSSQDGQNDGVGILPRADAVTPTQRLEAETRENVRQQCPYLDRHGERNG